MLRLDSFTCDRDMSLCGIMKHPGVSAATCSLSLEQNTEPAHSLCAKSTK